MIVVIDDDSECLAELTGILTADGYSVRPANSGELALVSISRRLPELILLDTRMPFMDGMEVCRRLKSCPQTREIPVVLLSGQDEIQERREGMRLGAADFISKPFHREEVIARVRLHLELKRLRSDLALQVAERTTNLRASNDWLRAELTERNRAEEALRESEERFRNLANRAPVGMWILGPQGDLLFRNTRAFTFTGRMTPQSGKGWMSVIHPEDLKGVQAKYSAAVAACRGFRIECRIRRPNRKYRWVLHTGIPRLHDGVFAGYIGTSVDITDLKRRHERMLHAEKLESIGALAGGIAHDFNNLVGSIFAACDLALADIPPDSPACENIDRINAAATRAAQLVNLLTAYAGGHETPRDRIDLSLAVAEMMAVLKGIIPSSTTIETHLEEDMPEVHANITEIRQLVSNLVMNAAEALQFREGTIRVTTEYVYGGRERFGEAGLAGSKAFVRLIVSDDGCGMPPDVRARVFDPFYTTKRIGRGLGLAVVDGIVNSLGGCVTCTTVPGAGATFEVLLPCESASSVSSRHRLFLAVPAAN